MRRNEGYDMESRSRLETVLKSTGGRMLDLRGMLSVSLRCWPRERVNLVRGAIRGTVVRRRRSESTHGHGCEVSEGICVVMLVRRGKKLKRVLVVSLSGRHLRPRRMTGSVRCLGEIETECIRSCIQPFSVP